MKCEICHKADAETALHIEKDGKDKELYVCKACAAAAKHPKRKGRGKDKPVTVIGPDDKPPQFVEDFFKAAMGLVDGLGHMAHERKTGKKTCPVCHATWESINKCERFGCPSCWKTFADEIRKEILDGDYGSRHVGAMPQNTSGEDSRAYLKRELMVAVKRQNYEKAAEIQRKLDALGPEDGK